MNYYFYETILETEDIHEYKVYMNIRFDDAREIRFTPVLESLCI